MYRPVDSKTNFPSMEERILAFWETADTFKKSISQREGREEFVFYDGPPFATGLPHYGHFIPSTVKDAIPRYKTMRGFKVERRFGWDCHGLPVEYEMEKELGISGKKQIEDYGVAKFNEACRSIVLRYTREWRKVITRLGRWVDFDHDYKTMDPDYMETIWWVLSELWKKGLMYEGFYILPYCPRCSTALSNFELNLGGYLDVSDPAITVKFELESEPGTWFLAWTTTPWTLPSNLGLAVGADVRYVKVKESARDARRDGEEHYILAKDRLPAYYKDPSGYTIVAEYSGTQLKDTSYKPLFPFFAQLKSKGAFRVRLGDFVATDEGTGIVHTAPGFGEDDYNLFKGTEVPTICPVDEEGKFTSDVPPWAGLFVKDADKSIIKALKDQHSLVRHDSITHAYPHCWRCKSPLIYRAVSEWFVSVEKIKARMLAANEQIYWMPAHLKAGRFGKWLENARDWAISRSRYWGNPIPIWRCDSCRKEECIGSRAELEKKSGASVKDLHKHFIDGLTYSCSCGGTMHRISEVLDCWFESGAMPYAQNHYPFENRAHFDANFPAHFISESIDQTRGWFYTLVVLGAALFDKPTFKNVIVSGLILDSEGKKMSKSARNYADPMEVIASYGADAMRLFLLDSAVLRGEDLRFSEAGVKEVVKNVIIPLWNAYSFFVSYANIDGVTVQGAPPRSPSNSLDRWILSEAERMVEEVTDQLEAYDLQRAVDGFVGFIDLLNNWYIRRSRRRFWRSGNDRDKQEAYQALHAALMKLVMVAAPFIPFITEEMYSNLKTPGMPESVHLCDYPECDESRRDPELERRMKVTMRTVSMGRSLRTDYALKTRQPLKALHLVTRDPQERKILAEMEDLIKDELNVKSVVFRDNEDELVEYKAKANFRTLGKQLGKDMKTAAARIEALILADIHALLAGKNVSLTLGDRTITLSPDGVEIQRIEKEHLKVINDGSLTVALDPELSPELIEEGLVRDLVRGIQNLRKDRGLEVTDRIELMLFGPEPVRSAAEHFREHLLSETLATSWKWEKAADAVTIECGEETCAVSLKKASR